MRLLQLCPVDSPCLDCQFGASPFLSMTDPASTPISTDERPHGGIGSVPKGPKASACPPRNRPRKVLCRKMPVMPFEALSNSKRLRSRDFQPGDSLSKLRM